MKNLQNNTRFRRLVLVDRFTVRRIRQEMEGLDDHSDAYLVKKMLEVLRRENDNRTGY